MRPTPHARREVGRVGAQPDGEDVRLGERGDAAVILDRRRRGGEHPRCGSGERPQEAVGLEPVQGVVADGSGTFGIGHGPIVPAHTSGMPVLPERPLVSVDALASRLGAPDVRIVDCRWYLGRPGAGRAAFFAGHIPGAIHLDLDADLSAPEGPGRHPLPDPDVFTAHLATLGIGREHEVVGYDDAGGWVAARLWWMLDNLGHPQARVLDGGWGAWLAAGHPTAADERALLPAAPWTPSGKWTRIVDRASLKPRLGSVVLLDARAARRYRGEVEPIDPVAGHIPTAINVPIDGNLGPDGRFLPPAELAARFRAVGAGPATAEVVTSCGSGTSACHHALAMRVAGLADPILYVGSYSDWSRAGEPVATGSNPGTPVR